MSDMNERSTLPIVWNWIPFMIGICFGIAILGLTLLLMDGRFPINFFHAENDIQCIMGRGHMPATSTSESYK